MIMNTTLHIIVGDKIVEAIEKAKTITFPYLIHSVPETSHLTADAKVEFAHKLYLDSATYDKTPGAVMRHVAVVTNNLFMIKQLAIMSAVTFENIMWHNVDTDLSSEAADEIGIIKEKEAHDLQNLKMEILSVIAGIAK